MARELAISIYLFVFRLLFDSFKRFPQKKKTVFVASFGDNVLFTLKELEKQTDERIIILKANTCKINFENTSAIIIEFNPLHFYKWIQSIYHLATTNNIFIDNYFGFLSVAKFKPDVQCVQLWHAAGAIKKFGLKDPAISNRSNRALKRFRKVYHRFTHVVVGSEKMASIFQKSFDLPDEVMLRTGIPRSDLFYDKDKQETVEKHLREQYPVIAHKKVILYAPTYRDETLNATTIALDIEQLYKQLSNDYVLFLRLHPAVTYSFYNYYADFVYDVSDVPDINHLLLITDILITDYSSIPFEFALFEQPMIFFAYDLNKYEVTRGFWENYETLVPGPVVSKTDDIVDVIENDIFDREQIRDFANEWNQYSKGNASKSLIHALYKDEIQYHDVEQETTKT